MVAAQLLMVAISIFASCSKTTDDDKLPKQEDAETGVLYVRAANTDLYATEYAQELKQALETNIESNVPIRFEVSSSEKWCVAKVLTEPYRLQLSLSENQSISERKAVVTVESEKYDVSVTFNITQKAAWPTLRFSNDDEGKEQHKTASSQSWKWTVQSNLPYDDIEVQSTEGWCQVELADDDSAEDMKNYELTTTISDNPTEQRRNALVTILSKSRDIKKSYLVVQSGSTITVLNRKLVFDRGGGSRNVTVKSDASWQAECDADWITLEQSGVNLVIHTTSTTDDRTAQVTFKGRESPTITVNQIKYKAGDAYDVDGVVGTVGYVGDDKQFIFKQLDEELQYRQYDSADLDGTSNKDDGQANTIAAIENYIDKHIKYPAFTAAIMLNSEGNSGWYLPAINELSMMKAFITGSAWSSTEAYVLLAYSHDGSSTQIINKTKKLKVYAIRKF